jgi:hypothetical protein
MNHDTEVGVTVGELYDDKATRLRAGRSGKITFCVVASTCNEYQGEVRGRTFLAADSNGLLQYQVPVLFE